MKLFILSTVALIFSGCGPDYGVELDKGGLSPAEDNTADDEVGGINDDDETGDETPETDDDEEPEEDFSEYEGAIIRIVDPPSGSFLPWGEEHTYEAVILTPEGETLEFDEIDWSSDLDEAWLPEGATFDDDTIDVGTHNLTATATLPDGSRVAHTVGGVLVQHEDAGTYVGDMVLNLSAEFEGVPVGSSCIGAAIVVVDAYGETAEGASECTLDLLGYVSFDVSHTFEYALDETDLDGNAFVVIPFVGFELPFPSEGNLEEGEITSDWEGGFPGFADITGTLDATRLTREITSL